jgi:signal transduction histidine kinase/PAS domain-containing protein
MFVLTICLPDLHQELTKLKQHAPWNSLELLAASSWHEAETIWYARKPDACFLCASSSNQKGGDAQQFIRGRRASWEALAIYAVLDTQDEDDDSFEQLLMDAGATDCIRSSHLGRPMYEHYLRRARRDHARLYAQHERNLFFDLMVEDMRIGLWQWDPRDDSYQWSEQEYRLFELDSLNPEEVSYLRWRDAIHPDDQERVEAEISRAIVGVSRYDSVFRMRSPGADGRPRWVAGVGRLMRDHSGSPARLYGVNWDVSVCRNAEAESMQRLGCSDCLSHVKANMFQQYFNLSADCLFHVKAEADGSLRYTAINSAGSAHAGKPVRDIIGKTPVEVVGREVGTIIEAGLRQALESGVPFQYKPSFNMSGANVTFDVTYIPIADEWGRYSGALGCARDVTDHERLQATLLQAQKMEVLGQFSSGVAHDFNNTLQNLSNLIELFQYARDPYQVGSLLKRGRAIIACGKALTSRLLAFARKGEPLVEVLDPNTIIMNVQEILQLSVGTGIEIQTTLEPGIWPVMADPVQMDLMLINLAVNARDAMGRSGSLNITTRNLTLCGDPDGVLQDSAYVCISVSDTGAGMPADVLAQATQPFFTTKPAGQGTGLGLSMVCRYLRDMSGDCKITSQLGQGTCVSMYLPRAN